MVIPSSHESLSLSSSLSFSVGLLPEVEDMTTSTSMKVEEEASSCWDLESLAALQAAMEELPAEMQARFSRANSRARTASAGVGTDTLLLDKDEEVETPEATSFDSTCMASAATLLRRTAWERRRNADSVMPSVDWSLPAKVVALAAVAPNAIVDMARA